MSYTFFRIIGSGLSGAVRRSPEEAWASVAGFGRRAYGYAAHDEGTMIAAHSLRLVEGTRRGCEAADISMSQGSNWRTK